MKLAKEYLEEFKIELKDNWPIPTLLFVYVMVMHLFFSEITSCPFRLIFGIPCPFCGLTRATFAILRLDVVASLKYTLLLPLLTFTLFLFIFRRRPLWSKIFHSKVFRILSISFVLIYYVIRMILIFPNDPMAINNNALIFIIFGR